MASYPNNPWSPGTNTDNVTSINKAYMDSRDDEIKAIEDALGYGNNALPTNVKVVNGKVGIGTSQPQDNLHIKGAPWPVSGPAIRLEWEGTREWRIVNKNYFTIVDASQADEIFTLTGGGGSWVVGLGIGGVLPKARVHVKGAIMFDNSQTIADADIAEGEVAMRLDTSNSSQPKIKFKARVGATIKTGIVSLNTP